MTCERCYQEIINESDHGWMICELLPRIKVFSTNSWSQRAWKEKELHSADVLQPINKRGQINEDFIKVHGTKELQKQWKMSDKEIRENAK